jgi:predicted acetyltransferase
VISALYPFRPDFYRRLGWALVGELHVYRFRPESLEPAAQAPVRLATREDEPAIAACYARAADRSNGLIERSSKAWRRHLDAPAAYAFIHEDHGVRGYMLLRYGRGAGGREHRTLLIRELVADDGEVAAALFGWISLQRDLWRSVRYDAVPDEHFWLRLRDPRPPGHRSTRWLWDPVARVIRGPMLRILDIRESIERRRVWGPAPAQSFTLAVRDAELPENETELAVDFDGARAVPRPPTAATQNRLETDIGTLTQLYAGELGVRVAVSLGLARVSGDVGALDALFRPRSAFRLLDEF